MPEYDFTRGTQILTLATVTLFISWILSMRFYLGSPIIFTLIATFFSTIATYAAATDMDMSVFQRMYVASSRYLGETSAASTCCLVTLGIVALDVLIWIAVRNPARSHFMDIIALILAIIGGGLVLFGGIVAHKEWEI